MSIRQVHACVCVAVFADRCSTRFVFGTRMCCMRCDATASSRYHRRPCQHTMQHTYHVTDISCNIHAMQHMHCNIRCTISSWRMMHHGQDASHGTFEFCAAHDIHNADEVSEFVILAYKLFIICELLLQHVSYYYNNADEVPQLAPYHRLQ